MWEKLVQLYIPAKKYPTWRNRKIATGGKFPIFSLFSHAYFSDNEKQLLREAASLSENAEAGRILLAESSHRCYCGS
jgi:hypothetical protein